MRWRHWVCWLMLLAVPLQGWAAASMLHSAAGTPLPVHAGCEGHAGTADDGTSAAPTSCAACAACCLAGGVLPAALPLISPTPQARHVAGGQPHQIGFITGAPERPPRASCV